MEKEHTLSDGRQALKERAEFHRAEAERFDKLVAAIDEATKALNGSVNGIAKNISRGRPADVEERRKMKEAISQLSGKFSFRDAKEAAIAAGVNAENFGRLFRELCEEGHVETEVPAMGRQAGSYVKIEGAEAK